MTNEFPSGWVPGKLPEFKSRHILITINDHQISVEVTELAEKFRIEPVDLGKKFIRLGLLAAEIEQNPDTSLVERDRFGRTELVLLNNQEYILDPSEAEKKVSFLGTEFTFGRPRLELSMPGELGGVLMELGNRYQTTIDDVLRKMFILGIKVGRAQSDHDKYYIIQDKNKGDRELILL